MFKSCGLKVSALSEVFSSLVLLRLRRSESEATLDYTAVRAKENEIYTEENHVWL